MKQSDIKKCAICDLGMMHSGAPLFYIMTIQHYMMDLGAVQRQHGLEMFMGEAAPLAQIMGPNEDLAKPLSKEIKIWVCQDCAIKHLRSITGLPGLDEPVDGYEEYSSKIKKFGE